MLTGLALEAAERGWAPDLLVKMGIRSLLRGRLREQQHSGSGGVTDLVATMRCSPIALAAASANEQHYELPPEFFRLILGRRLKYSCGYWNADVTSLDASEDAMLALTTQRAGIEDGMEILDLGCGWGSFTFWALERFPHSRILAVSNSRSQGRYIEARCRRLGIDRVEVVTADMNSFDPGSRRFHRVVSVEMFEHMRNYHELLERVSRWLRPDGRLFVHVFSHHRFAYLFEDHGENDWMARHFFTGGLMPSDDLLSRFFANLHEQRRWRLDGRHYERTLRCWLQRLDTCRDQILRLFEEIYGREQAQRWMQRWRLFFLACAELFGYRDGSEWGVTHALLAPAGGSRSTG